MVMTAAGTTALVAGSSMENRDMAITQTKSVRVVRPFYYGGGKLTKVGDLVDLPTLLAREVCAANKAMMEDRPAPAPEQPQPVEVPKSLLTTAKKDEPAKQQFNK